jgi:3-hydroxybutyryl-CoA dehydratase
MDERSSFNIGEEAELTKIFTIEEVQEFSRISNDTNPIHVDKEYASKTFFKSQLVHGILVSGLISAVLGTCLPGPGAIYMSQSLRFCAPVFPGDKVTARVKVTDWDGVTGRVTLSTEAVNQQNTLVITGEAKLVMSAFIHKG